MKKYFLVVLVNQTNFGWSKRHNRKTVKWYCNICSCRYFMLMLWSRVSCRNRVYRWSFSLEYCLTVRYSKRAIKGSVSHTAADGHFGCKDWNWDLWAAGICNQTLITHLVPYNIKSVSHHISRSHDNCSCKVIWWCTLHEAPSVWPCW